jgi:putative phosphoesterase
MIRLGLIADTHGMVRPKVHTVFEGVDLILHAGDVCGDDVLIELRTIAPVHAVAGNCDPIGDPDLPLVFEQVFEQVHFHMSHGHELGRPTPEELLAHYKDADVIIYGHTHHQMIFDGAGRMVVNPGAAGARRFKLPPSVAVMQIDEDRVSVEIVALE